MARLIKLYAVRVTLLPASSHNNEGLEKPLWAFKTFWRHHLPTGFQQSQSSEILDLTNRQSDPQTLDYQPAPKRQFGLKTVLSKKIKWSRWFPKSFQLKTCPAGDQLKDAASLRSWVRSLLDYFPISERPDFQVHVCCWFYFSSFVFHLSTFLIFLSAHCTIRCHGQVQGLSRERVKKQLKSEEKL